MSDFIANRRLIYRGRKIDLALQEVNLADGSQAEREVVLHRGAVALLAFVDDEHICLVRNGRYAVEKTLLEIPAGTIDSAELPDQTAPRELREETGYIAGKIERIAEWFVSPGVFNERMYLYVCTDLIVGPTEHQADERLEPVVVPWTEAVIMAQDGRIEDAKSMLGILLFDTMRARRGT